MLLISVGKLTKYMHYHRLVFSHIETPERQRHWNDDYNQVSNTVLVSKNALPSDRSPHSAPFRFKNASPTIQAVKISPTVSEASTFSSHPRSL